MYLQNSDPNLIAMRYVIFTLFSALLFLIFGFSEKTNVKVADDNKGITNNFSETGEKDNVIDAGAKDQGLGFVEYAKTLIGTPYLYGSTDPRKGLDCSGFINAVSNHFGIKVPRSSVEFTNLGITIDTSDARPGDLILFTGTDKSKRVVGHIGIISEKNEIDGELSFIHSSSGKANGVTISDLSGYYESRFVKVIRIFPTSAERVVG